jgi:hypothetical protein
MLESQDGIIWSIISTGPFREARSRISPVSADGDAIHHNRDCWIFEMDGARVEFMRTWTPSADTG